MFDAGGTLVRLDFEWMAELVSAAWAIDRAGADARAEVEGRRRYDRSRRSARRRERPARVDPGDIRAYFGGMLEAAGVPDADISRAWWTRSWPREKIDGLVEPADGGRTRRARWHALALGLRRAVVSNSDGRAEWHLGLAACSTDSSSSSTRTTGRRREARSGDLPHRAASGSACAPERALYVGDIRSVDDARRTRRGHAFRADRSLGDYGAPGDIRFAPSRTCHLAQRFDVPPTGRTARAATAKQEAWTTRAELTC